MNIEQETKVIFDLLYKYIGKDATCITLSNIDKIIKQVGKKESKAVKEGDHIAYEEIQRVKKIAIQSLVINEQTLYLLSNLNTTHSEKETFEWLYSLLNNAVEDERYEIAAEIKAYIESRKK